MALRVFVVHSHLCQEAHTNALCELTDIFMFGGHMIKGEVTCIAKTRSFLRKTSSQNCSRHLSPMSENSDLEGAESQVWGILDTVAKAQTSSGNGNASISPSWL